MTISGWVAVDLDGTLAKYEGWGDGSIGEPIPRMVERVKRLIEAGAEVRIFTARVCVVEGIGRESQMEATREFAENQRKLIEAWCEEHLGKKLKVTNIKDFGMLELWDDRARQVVFNEGIFKDEEIILR